MRKISIAVLFVFAAATFAAAQTTNGPSALDVIVGYSLLRVQIANELAPIGLEHANASGGEAALVFGFAHGIGLEVQGTGYYKKLTEQQLGLPPIDAGNLALYTAMVGPQFKTYTDSNVNPFIHALFGVARGHVGNESVQPLTAFERSVFAADLGGGVDFKVSRHLSLRGEIAYVYTQFPFPQIQSGLGDSQNDVKVTAALVFHL
jgi:opacity protein-like surface antigen